MKKALSAILLIFYFATSSGVVINLHYCMNRFDSLQLGAAKAEICGKCGMHVDNANGCCKDEVKIIKVQDDQQAASLQYQFASFDALQKIPLSFLTTEITDVEKPLFLNNHSPPISKQYTYLQNCVFRI